MPDIICLSHALLDWGMMPTHVSHIWTAVVEQRATPTLWNPFSVLSVSHYAPAFIFSPFPLISFSFLSHLYCMFFLSFYNLIVLSRLCFWFSHICSSHPHLCSCSRLLCSLHFTCKILTASLHVIMLLTS